MDRAVLTARGTLIAGILAAMGASVCCADPRTIKRQRLTFWIVAVALLGVLAVPLAAPLLY